MQQRQLTITPQEAYDFQQLQHYFLTSFSAILEQVHDNTYERVFTFDQQHTLLRITEKPNAYIPGTLQVDVIAEKLSEQTLTDARDHIAHIFSLQQSTTPLQRLADKDSVLAEEITPFQKLRPVLIGTPFEALIWAILGQLIHISFAHKLKQRLQACCGDTFSYQGRQYPVFPTPEQILSLDDATLRDIQLSRQKITYIRTAAQAVKDGTLDFHAVRHMTEEQARQTLMQYKGIGRWTAEYVLMRGLGFSNILPAGDLGIRDKIGHMYQLASRPTAGEVRQLTKDWSPDCSWATFILWYQLQVEHSGTH